MPTVSRRTLVAGGAAGAVAVAIGAVGLSHAAPMAGTLDGANMARGHRLRDGGFPAPDREERTGVLIAGGGISGLAAAWALAEAGMADFRLLELEDRTGGNARSGRNAVSAFPLGAHYLPIPNPEARGVRHLLERLGIITGWDKGKPLFDPYQIVADPDERLLHLGRWQDGLIPTLGLSPRDKSDIAAFFATMAAYRDRRDGDGRPAFAIPMELSARDPDLLALDRQSFTQWLDAQGWHSPILRAHIRYACRDDYGTEPDQVSAWAGVHYFASRRGEAANCAGDAVLTWPEGNDHLATAMAQRVAPHISGGRIVFAVAREGRGAIVDSFDVATGRSTRWHCDAAIVATPHFVSRRIVRGASTAASGFSYAPWVVANVTVDRLPRGPGVGPAWDNVSSSSESLGYVIATHQGLGMAPGATVLSWYMPLSREAPAEARRILADRSLAEWQAIVEADLLATNPDLKGAIRRIDLWRWGHAMIRPTPGFLWGAERETAARADPPLFAAHSDLSGMSIFEEAHYRGTLAAEAAMQYLGVDHVSILAS